MGTQTRLLLLAPLHPLQIQDGPAPLREPPPSPPLQEVTSQGDRPAQVLQGSSRFLLVLELQDSTQALPQHLVATPPALGSQDSIHQELQGSSPPVLEPPGSFQGITHLREPQDSSPEGPFHTQPDRLLPALELPLGPTPMCLSQEVSQEEGTGCTDQVVQADTRLQPVLVPSLHSLLEGFLPYLLGRGDHLEGEGSHLLPAPTVLVQDPWVLTGDLPLQEACW